MASVMNMPLYIQKMHDVVNSRAGPVFAILASVQQTDAEQVLNAENQLENFGYSVDRATCIELNAFVGETNFPYRWCAVNKTQP